MWDIDKCYEENRITQNDCREWIGNADILLGEVSFEWISE